MSDVSDALSKIATVADAIGELVGGPVSTVLHEATVVVRAANGVIHELTAEDIEKIHRSAMTGMSAGLAAYLASKSAGKAR